jgi:TonB family protein
MTRLQKKCLIAAASAHLLVVIAILCSGFIRPSPKTDDTQVLDVIPSILVDKALNTGVANPQTPPPTPPQPTPTPPTPQVQPPTPTPPAPEPPKPQTFVERVEKMLTPDMTPVERTPDDQPKPAPKKHQIDVDLKPVVHKISPTTDTSADDAREAKRLRDERRKAFAAAARAIKENASTATKVELSGVSSASSASYNSALLSIYYHAWMPPENMSTDFAVVGFSVTISRDGTVIESHVVTSSGDADIDRAVQQMLDRVTFIAPFPEGAQDSQRTYPINFKATRTSIQ